MAPRTRYFAFGSNLWQHQMSLRCPSSPFIGLARLRGYKWFINARGYANIAPIPPSDEQQSQPEDYTTEVWGLVYTLSPPDEAQLDRNEGVPEAYQKEFVAGIDFWPAAAAANPTPNRTTTTTATTATAPPLDITAAEPEQAEMLVYIDHYRNTGGHKPREEYVHRMNMGIRDALREGVPRGYVERVLRGYIPGEEQVLEGVVDEGLRRFALRRAAGLERDERVDGNTDGDLPGVGSKTGLASSAAVGPSGSGVVATAEEEEEELPERASQVCYLKEHGV